MADGDIIRGLRRCYLKPYNNLYEGKATNAECTRALLKALKQDLKKKGTIPIHLAKGMGDILDNAMSSTHNSIDWFEISRSFYALIQTTDGPHYLKELVLRAGQSILHDCKYKKIDIQTSSSEVILQKYILEVYDSGFKSPSQHLPENHPESNSRIVLARIQDIEPNILESIDKWAKKADTDGEFNKIRLPRLFQKKPIDLEEDLVAGYT